MPVVSLHTVLGSWLSWDNASEWPLHYLKIDAQGHDVVQLQFVAERPASGQRERPAGDESRTNEARAVRQDDVGRQVCETCLAEAVQLLVRVQRHGRQQEAPA